MAATIVPKPLASPARLDAREPVDSNDQTDDEEEEEEVEDEMEEVEGEGEGDGEANEKVVVDDMVAELAEIPRTCGDGGGNRSHACDTALDADGVELDAGDAELTSADSDAASGCSRACSCSCCCSCSCSRSCSCSCFFWINASTVVCVLGGSAISTPPAIAA